MNAPVAIVQVTARNVLAIKRLLGFGLLTLVPALIFFLSSRTATEQGKVENFTGAAVLMFSVVIPIVSIVISGSVLGTERRGSTLSFLMLRPLSRFTIATAKLVSAIVSSFAIAAIGSVALGALATITIGDFSYLTASVVGTLIAVAGYSAVFMPLGYLTERATLIGFIYIFVWEAAVAGIILGLSGTSLWRIAASAFEALASGGLESDIIEAATGSLAPGVGGAIFKMGALCLISIAFTGWLLRTRDLT